MDCRELKAMMDSYISDELLIETNHEVLRHLENCADCRGEMSSRRALKDQLRHAVKSSDEMQIDAVFYSRTAAKLKEVALRPGSWERLTGGRFLSARFIAVGLAWVMLATVGSVVWINRSRDTAINIFSNSNSDLANAVRASWAQMTSLAVGDHENCAVKFRLKEDPITLDEAAVKFGSYNKDLDKVVMAAFKTESNTDLGADIQFLEAHSCIYNGRRFAHIVVKHKGRVVSLLVTDTDLPTDNDDVQTARYDGAMNAAGFHFGHHAVFVVSELPAADNVMVAKAIAPAIRLHVEKLGA
jgi:hypothetical protein